ncbi:MAG: arginine deiminase family protein [Ruegeria sp.]
MDINTTRRDLWKLGAGAAVAAGAATSIGGATMAAASTPNTDPNRVFVDYEWGALKEVVCGIPNFSIPTSIPEAVYKYAPADGLKFFEENLGKTIEEADPAQYKAATEQMDAVVAILEERDVIVHRLAKTNAVEEAYQSDLFPASVIQYFPRDPMVVIGNKFIETEPYLPIRRRERFGVRRAVDARLAASDAQMVAMPIAVPTPEQEDGTYGVGPFLEGGDVFVLGKDIYVGNTGNASNTAGIEWLAQYLGADYNVQEIPMSDKFLHLDCALATPRPGLAIVCREAFTNGLPDFLKDWTLIDVPFKDAKQKLGCNGLVVDQKTIIIATGLDYLAKGLRDAGQEVIETPFDAVYQYAGAFRCWHHPLIREV